jgi:hypothetical protein
MEGEQGFVARVADNERQATYEHTDLTMSPLTGALPSPKQINNDFLFQMF